MDVREKEDDDRGRSDERRRGDAMITKRCETYRSLDNRLYLKGEVKC